MKPRFSLMGSHRTGKTTLAEAVAKALGIEFLSFSFSPSYEALGIPMGSDVSFEDRKRLQEHALKRMLDELPQSRDVGFISDRCPLDLIAYTLAEVPQDISKEDDAWVQRYIKLCIAATKENYDQTLLIRPGIDLVSDQTSWSSAQSVVDQIDAGMLWAKDAANKAHPRLVREMPGSIMDLADRIGYTDAVILRSVVSSL